MIGGVTKLLNIPVIAVAVFQNFLRYARRSTILLHSHIFKQKKYTILGATRKFNTQTSSLNCRPTLVSCRQEMVRSPQFNLFLFSKMTWRCNLKTCSYFGEVDIMQMICEWTHENILRQQ